MATKKPVRRITKPAEGEAPKSLMGNQGNRHQPPLQVFCQFWASDGVNLLQLFCKISRNGARRFETLHKFSGDVLGVRGRAAVTRNQKLSVMSIALFQNAVGLFNIFFANVQHGISLNQKINVLLNIGFQHTQPLNSNSSGL